MVNEVQSRGSVSLAELNTQDAARYNQFFAAGVRKHLDLFRVHPDDIVAAPFSTTPSAEDATLIALGDEQHWLGVGSIAREQGRAKRRHIAWILRVFVAEPGQGTGRALVRALKSKALAMPGVSKVNVTLAAHNTAAIHLYTSEGFVEFSREPDAFRVADRSITELSMSWQAGHRHCC